MRLRSHLAQIFISKTSPAANVEGSNKAMAKLWKEAERVKKVLSVNVDHSAQVGSTFGVFTVVVRYPDLLSVYQNIGYYSGLSAAK